MWKTSKNFKKFIIGIDEVGRGALAGPVLVAAAVIPHKIRFPVKSLSRLRDSKRLTPLQRKRWFEFIKRQPQIFYVLARVNSKTIDKINISKAANRAATKAFKKLLTNNKQLTTNNRRVILDGSLYLDKNTVPFAKTVIKADEKYNCVKLASIVAKVSRDNYMKKLHKRYPHYGFDKHKGYGTREHIQTLCKYGHSQVHRLTFIRKYINIK
jgi:ribonuclease HII